MLPRSGGHLEALELVDDGQHPGAALELGAGGDVLPAEQEAHQVLGRDRLDLGAQPVAGVAVDPGEQPPGAPLDLPVAPRVEVGIEPALHGEALGLEPGEADRHPSRRQGDPLGQLGRGDGAGHVEMAPEHLGHQEVGILVGHRREVGRQRTGRDTGARPEAASTQPARSVASHSPDRRPRW